MAYNPKTWTEGTVVKPARVVIDGVEHEVLPEERTGATPLTPEDMNNISNEIGNLKLRVKTVTGLTLGAGTTYQLTLPANTIWIEPLVDCWGNDNAGGTFVTIGGGATYVVNNDKPIADTTFRGIWVTCNSSGLVSISDYRHCGLNITGFRIWYLGTE